MINVRTIVDGMQAREQAQNVLQGSVDALLSAVNDEELRKAFGNATHYWNRM